jgi:hypothetical protein
MTAVLPIKLDDENGFYLETNQVKKIGASLHTHYVQADPFPHIVLNDFLPPELIKKILENFPHDSVDAEVKFEIGYAGQFKRQIPPVNCNAFNRNLFAFLNSEPVLRFVESLTGIEKLIPDPYFAGGGYHETTRGGLLGIHADFRINKELNLNRRINMIIYLNDNWREEWGGALELWDKSMSAAQQKVFPILNRCVIFNTDQDSFHGHPDPLTCPENVTRKSIALYYYTASESVLLETPVHDTMYKARPGDTKENRKEAFAFSVNNYLIDWMPPVMFRKFIRFKNLINRCMNKIKKT